MHTMQLKLIQESDGTAVSPLLTAKIGFMSGFLLILLSMSLTFASVYNVGIYGFLGVIGLIFIIGVRRPSDIILIWLTFFYNPALIAGSNLPIFKVTIVISFFICFIFGKLLIVRLFNKALMGFVCFLLWLLFTAFISPDVKDAFMTYWLQFRNLFIIVLLISLVNTEEEMGRVLKWWAIIAALSIIPAMIHYHLGPNTWLYYAYERTGLQNVEKGSVNIGKDIIGRLVWAGNDANGRGATLLFPVGIALAYLVCSKMKYKFFWTTVLSLICICILGSFSRSSFICLVLILSVFALTMNIRSIVPLIVIYLAGTMAILFIPMIRDRIFSIHESVVAEGGSGRLYLWNEAMHKWLNSPLIGNGLRSFYGTTTHEVHNTYLELLSDTGVVGLFMFSILMVLACFWGYNSMKNRTDINQIFGKTIGCAMIGLCAMVGTITFYTEMILWIAFTICFLMYSFRNDNNSLQA